MSSNAGLSGRSLKLNPAWENPTGVWRLGLKRGYEVCCCDLFSGNTVLNRALFLQLFPNPLKKRLTAEAKKEWDIAHGKVVAGVMADLAGWAAANPETTKLTPAKLREKEDLDGRREYLNSFTFEDPGPVSSYCHRGGVQSSSTGVSKSHAHLFCRADLRRHCVARWATVARRRRCWGRGRFEHRRGTRAVQRRGKVRVIWQKHSTELHADSVRQREDCEHLRRRRVTWITRLWHHRGVGSRRD